MRRAERASARAEPLRRRKRWLRRAEQLFAIPCIERLRPEINIEIQMLCARIRRMLVVFLRLRNQYKCYQLPDENRSSILLQMDWSKPNILQTAECHAKLFSTCRWSAQMESRLHRTIGRSACSESRLCSIAKIT